MAAQGALAQRLPAADQAAELRADRVTALRQRNNISAGNVPAQPTPGGNTETDEADELQRNRNADRYANGIGSPMAPLYANLNLSDVDTNEAANSDFPEESAQSTSRDEEAMQNYTAFQSQIEDSEQSRARLKSLLRSLKEAEDSKRYQEMLKELKQFFQKRQTDLAAKGCSLIDEGELVEIIDTVGVGISTYQVVISIFKDSLPEHMKGQALDFAKSSADVASGAGTIMQLMKWTVLVFVVLPYIIALQVGLFTSICDSFSPCKAFYGGIFAAIGM